MTSHVSQTKLISLTRHNFQKEIIILTHFEVRLTYNFNLF